MSTSEPRAKANDLRVIHHGTAFALAAFVSYLSGLSPDTAPALAVAIIFYAAWVEWSPFLKETLRKTFRGTSVGSSANGHDAENDQLEKDEKDEGRSSLAHYGAGTTAAGAVVVPLVQPGRPAISASQMDTLSRNAQDGGANSIMASLILRKNVDLMILGQQRVEEMLQAAGSVQVTTKELFSLADEISRISRHAKMVTVNLSIEAARGGQEMAAFQPISEEMGRLAMKVQELTQQVELRLKGLQERTVTNEKICIAVGSQFGDINRELEAFRAVMNRAESLWTTQCEGLRTIEAHFIGKKAS